MPGKGHLLSWEERVGRTLRSGTLRTAGGAGSNASPGLVRDRLTASARGASSGLSPLARASKVDVFTVSDAATDTFTLTYVPVPGSWNLMLNGLRVHRDEWSITGKVITVTDAADLFLGADAQGSPWDLECQYDYYASVPSSPTEPSDVSFVGGADSAAVNPTLTGFGTVVAGDLMVLVVNAASGSISTPAGFTLYETPTAGGRLARVFTKVATGGETSVSVTADGGSFSRVASMLVVFRGASILAAGTPVTGSASSTTVPVLSGFTTGQTALVLAVSAHGTVSGSISVTSGDYTEAANRTDVSGKGVVLAAYWPSDAGSNPAGTVSFGGSVSGWWVQTLRLG